MSENAGATRHACKAEIGGVGEHGGHQGARVIRRRAGAQMREAIGEARPAMDFREQFGDAQARQHGVETAHERVGGLVLRAANWADRQPLVRESGFGQVAGGGERVDLAEARFQELCFHVAPRLEAIGNGETQFADRVPIFESVARQQKVIESAKGAAVLDPDVART